MPLMKNAAPLLFLLAALLFGCDATSHPDSDAGTDATTDVGPDSDTDGGTAPELWCATQWPLTVRTAPGIPTESLYARVGLPGRAVTAAERDHLTVEVGFGPSGTAPTDTSWAWSAAGFNASCLACTTDVEYMGSVTPVTGGISHWAARVRWDDGPWLHCDRADEGRAGSDDGWSESDAPLVVVTRGLTVVTLNLRCLLDDYASRLPLIIDSLASSGADLIGFQEVCAESGGADNLDDIVAGLTDRTGETYSVLRTVTHLSWDTYDEGIALITPHTITDEAEATLPLGAFQRKVVMARVLTPVGTVVMSTTHLDHLDAQTRADQITAVLDALGGFNTTGDAAILTGDFNEGPEGDVHTAMTASGFTDLWQSVYPSDPGYTYPASSPEIRIDYIWLDAGFSPVSIEQILTLDTGGVTGSDHVGLRGMVETP